MGSCLVLLALWAAITLLESWVAMLVWNWIMPTLFNLPVLTFWQSLGILFLINLIGSAFRSRSSK